MYVKVKSLKVPLWEKISTKMLFFVLASILIVIFGFYAYLVNKTIMNVVARGKVEQNISSLSSSIGDLEFKYMTIRNGITIDLAYAKGFLDAEPTQFISRNPSTLSYNSR